MGPVLALEYLENGTFTRLMNRARKHDVHLPNRMLWSLFLCRGYNWILVPIYTVVCRCD